MYHSGPTGLREKRTYILNFTCHSSSEQRQKLHRRPLRTLARGSPGRKAPPFLFPPTHPKSRLINFEIYLLSRYARRKTQPALVSATLRTPDISRSRYSRLLDKKHCAPLYELSWGLLACLSFFFLSRIWDIGARDTGKCMNARERRYRFL